MATNIPAFQALDEGTVLRSLRTTLEDPVQILDGIGAMMKAESQKAFREQRWGNVKWKTRGETGMNPNWPGVLADLKEGPTPKPQRFRDAPVLLNKGDLKKSVDFWVIGRDTVEVGSPKPWAGPLHAGEDTESPEITESIQRKLWDWIKRATGAVKRTAKRAGKLSRSEPGSEKAVKAQRSAETALTKGEGALKLKWLLNKNLRGSTITITHPARPFVGIHRTFIEDVEEVFGVVIGEAE